MSLREGKIQEIEDEMRGIIEIELEFVIIAEENSFLKINRMKKNTNPTKPLIL